MGRDEKGEDQILAVSFAAGMAVCMACVQRAILVSVFVHWRMSAFLALNLLLLAILFTSKFQKIQVDQGGGDFEKKKKKTREESKVTELGIPAKKTREESEVMGLGIPAEGSDCDEKASAELPEVAEDKMGNEEEDDEGELSKEELNKRVEAFIAMFRQHLVCDAKGKSCEQHTY